ncbi:MAG: hypothetical protein MI974_25455 [Chitinophagales bacterium]|nr:hypothetical protein [Chitinophagales bacterium]
MTGTVKYFKSLLKTEEELKQPVNKVFIDNKEYLYFSELSGKLAEDIYWYHKADMNIPESFQLVTYAMNNDGTYTFEHENLNQGYGSNHFLLNIIKYDERSPPKVTYRYNEDIRGFEKIEDEIHILKDSFGWDYKKTPEDDQGIIPLACGVKCREPIKHGLQNKQGASNWQLLIFKDKDTSYKPYYIPCLGKTLCESMASSDVVYFKCSEEEVINEWIAPIKDKSFEETPGINVKISHTYFSVKTFKGKMHHGLLAIHFTSDSSHMQVNECCKPRRELC